jgi:hypothetical protein
VPDIKSFKITNEHDFIVLASKNILRYCNLYCLGDGIYDKLSNHEVIDCVWMSARDVKAANVH